MENDIQKQIQDRLAELPPEIQSAIVSADMGSHIHDIGQKHNLHVDQIGALEDETMLVMLGFFEAEDFSNQIKDQLRVPAEEAQKIADDVTQEVFLPIRESMKKFMEARTVAPAAPAPPSAALPAQPAKAAVQPAPKTDLPLVQSAAPIQTAEQDPKPIAEKSQKPTYKTDPYREPIE